MKQSSEEFLPTVEQVHPDAAVQQAIISDEHAGKNDGVGKSYAKALRKETTPSEWLAQVQICERANQESFRQARANLRHFAARHGGTRIRLPLLTRLIANRAAMATHRDPYLSVRPRKKATPTHPGEILASAVKESWLNLAWAQLKLKYQVRRSTVDALLLTGRGIIVPGYSAIFDNENFIMSDTVTAYRRSPFDVFLDVESDCTDNSWYCITRHLMPIPIAMARFGKNIPFKTHRYSRWVQGKPSERADKYNTLRQFTRTVIYEIHDLMRGQFLFVTPGVDRYLDKFDTPYPISGLIPCFLEPLSVPDSFECIAEATLLRPLVEEKCQLRSYSMEQWRKTLARYIYDGISDENIQQLKNADTMAFVRGDPNNIKLLETHNVPPDMLYHETRIDKDIQDMGHGEYARGGMPGKTKTAYEASEIVAGSNLPVADLNDFVEKFSGEIGHKLLLIAREMVGPEEMRYATGVPMDLREWGIPQNIDLNSYLTHFDTEVTVHAGSMALPSKQRDMQRAMMLDKFLMWPEANRMAILEQQAKMLDFDAGQLFKEVPPEQQREAQMMALMRGKSRQEGGKQTGTLSGSRTRPEMQIPGGV